MKAPLSRAARWGAGHQVATWSNLVSQCRSGERRSIKGLHEAPHEALHEGGVLEFPFPARPPRIPLPFLTVAAAWAALAGTAAAAVPSQRPQPPEWRTEAPSRSDDIFVLSMGPDHDDLFREWGHAALCVGESCFNYGVTDFSRPVGLLFDVLLGRALFWVAVTPYQHTLATYAAHDRTVFRQDLDLSPEARSALLGKLSRDLVPGASEYLYNHFEDNCTTRIRDYLDDASGGGLQGSIGMPPEFAGRGGAPATFRSQIRRGLADRPLLLWVSDVGVGTAVDHPISDFELMFLPGGLRAGVEAGFDAPAEKLRAGRDGDLLPADPGSGPYVPWLLLVAAGVSGLILRGGRFGRMTTVAAAATLMLLGAIGLFLRFASPLAEFSTSFLFLAAPATDAALATRWAGIYAPARLVFAAGLLVVLLTGMIPQPLGWTVLAAMLPVAAIWWVRRREGSATVR